MKRSSLPLAAVLLLALWAALAIPAGADSVEIRDEEFHYRWHLKNFLGRIASLFLPGSGEGSLTFHVNDKGLLQSELLITSEKSEEGEFWHYGSEMDLQRGRTVRAWTSYRYRGKSKSEKARVEEEGVADMALGIYLIRQDLPEEPRRMRIWSDGKIYPVVVIPRGEETRTIAGDEVATRHFTVEGVKEEGERYWKGKLDLWLAQDDAATPVELVIHRRRVGVRLELQP